MSALPSVAATAGPVTAPSTAGDVALHVRARADVRADRAASRRWWAAGPPDLEILTAAAREGDREAFEQLVVATSAGCYQLAYRLVGNEHDARDVVQETYLRAYKGLKRFRGDATVTTWLHRITVNCALRHLERRSRSATAELDAMAEIADERPERDPETAASAADERGRLVEALGELPPSLRAVVVLRDVYDLPHREIAKELGISQGAAKVRLHRARTLLRERIFPRRRGEA